MTGGYQRQPSYVESEHAEASQLLRNARLELRPISNPPSDLNGLSSLEQGTEVKKNKRHMGKCVMFTVLTVLILTQTVLTILMLSKWNANDSGKHGESSESNALSQEFKPRSGFSIQGCVINNTPTFPNIDYAFLGYNIFKGFPHATGHDPGFSHPIFRADYNVPHTTADCRHRLPNGVTVISDLGCVLSFSSSEVKTEQGFKDSLSQSAHVGGGFLGFKFSASQSFKKAISELSSGESLFIISSTSCNYHYVLIDSPPFTRNFIDQAKRLANHNATNSDIIGFIEYFGTHFVSKTRFGARHLYQHKMKTSTYNRMKSSSFSVGVEASLWGKASAGFELSKEQETSVSKFSKNVVTTSSTIGAPLPEKSSAAEWAKQVRDTAVPIEYTLESIDKLFTTKYMEGLGFDYAKVKEKITIIVYCQMLKDKGMVNNCQEDSQGWVTFKTFVSRWGALSRRATEENICLDQCLSTDNCSAIQTCHGDCPDQNLCYFRGPENMLESEDERFQSNGKLTILTSKLEKEKAEFRISDALIEGGGSIEDALFADNITVCKQACQEDLSCNVFNYYKKDEDPKGMEACRLYSAADLHHPRNLQYQHEAVIQFIPEALHTKPRNRRPKKNSNQH